MVYVCEKYRNRKLFSEWSRLMKQKIVTVTAFDGERFTDKDMKPIQNYLDAGWKVAFALSIVPTTNTRTVHELQVQYTLEM